MVEQARRAAHDSRSKLAKTLGKRVVDVFIMEQKYTEDAGL
jgi:hypothetical protein